MLLGTTLLYLCLGLTVASIAGYIASATDKAKLPIARMAYYAMATGVVATSAYLLHLILRHEFNAQYVFWYTSRDLPVIYQVSAFWAGQEGSFLLWALFGAVIGLILSAKSKEYEPWVMAFWGCVQAFFFALLLVKSPFAQTPMTDLMASPDGHGLNPLLQNFWIAIHPPVLFLGYAAMAVPAAFVTAGLIRKDYTGWSNRCLPWAIFGWLSLGAGIILGSYWAYEVLGWGGYWGWDPVENASLVPWLAATALLHSMLVERYRGSMRRTNIALALLSFLLVMYATYLTRSGVLGDFSVHSFEATGSNGYLLGFLVLFTLISGFVFVWRGLKSPSSSWYGDLVSKEFAFFVGIISLCALAMLVLFGTSTPIITKLMGQVAKNVPQSYYGKISAPTTLVILIVLTLAPVLAWTRRGAGERVLQPLLLPAVGAVAISLLVGAGIVVSRGLNAGALVAIGLTGSVAVLVNLWSCVRYGPGNWKMIGGYLAHVGVALMLIGMVMSPSIQAPAHVEVPLGGETSKLGYKFSFLRAIDRPDKFTFIMNISGHGQNFVADPAIRPTREGILRAPYIKKSFSRDLYIAPVQIKVPEIEPALKMTDHGMEFVTATTPDGGAVVRLMKIQVPSVILLIEPKGERPVAISLAKGESKQVGKYKFTFNQFDVTGDHGSMGGNNQYGAKITVDYPGVTAAAVLEVSVKRFISLLWLGAILTLCGGGIAIVRRVGENRKLLSAASVESEDAVTDDQPPTTND